MNVNNPFVSVIIPTYNRSHLTIRAVESVLSQTYKNLEIILVDDGSTDDTKERLHQYKERVRYIYKENGGVCSARNVGIRNAAGSIIAFLDSDDMYEPQKIELSVRYLLKHPHVGLVHTAAYFIDDDDNILDWKMHHVNKKTGWKKEKLVFKNFICNPTIVTLRKYIDKAGWFNEELIVTGDWDMWLRISEYCQVGSIDIPLSKYRITSMSCYKNLDITSQETFYILEEFFKRNSDVSYWCKRKSYSRHYLSMAECYLLKEDYQKMKEQYVLALKNYPFSLKTVGILLYYIVAFSSLRKRLSKAILFQ